MDISEQFIGVSTEALINELGSRFDHWAFVGLKKTLKEEGMVDTRKQYGGGYTECIGLCTKLAHSIANDEEYVTATIDEEDIE